MENAIVNGKGILLTNEKGDTAKVTANHLEFSNIQGNQIFKVDGKGLEFSGPDGTKKFIVDINGCLRAVTKSFDIPHPVKENKRLVHGCLEGPENGIYCRGEVKYDRNKIAFVGQLPDYWESLVGIDYDVYICGPVYEITRKKGNEFEVFIQASNGTFMDTSSESYRFFAIGNRDKTPFETTQD